jgi:hypothetical protein
MRRFFEGLSDEDKAKLDRDYQRALTDPLAQEFLANMKRNISRSVQEREAKKLKQASPPAP